MARSILVVDDENVLARAMADYLTRHGYVVNVEGSGEQALRVVEEEPPDLVLLDYRLPRMDGLQVLRKIKDSHPEIEVIMLTAHGSVEKAVEAMKLGAFDYLSKPIDLEELRLVVKKALESLRRSHELDYLRSRADKENPSHEIVGGSEPMRKVQALIERIASIEATSGREAPAILITGETGTGKELVARAIHALSRRSAGPFVEINCAAIPQTLLEAELFGYEKGAFTDAKTAKIGLFEAADTGTLFLDEIGTMDLGLQAKLLKAIEEKAVRRLGSIRSRRFDIMLIAATNQPLERAIQERVFREDLYYRLKVLTVDLPPLRERGGDAVLLAEHFVGLHARRYNHGGQELSAAAKQAIADYYWPGNVRELSNVLERAVILQHGSELRPSAFLAASPVKTARAPQRRAPAAASGSRTTLDEVEKQHILAALEEHKGNYSRAARAVGISLTTLKRKLKKYQGE